MWRKNEEDLHAVIDFGVMLVGVILVFVGFGLEFDWYGAMIVLGLLLIGLIHRKYGM